MTIAQRIAKIQNSIASADANLLEKLERLIAEHKTESTRESVISDDQKQLLDERLAMHKANPSAGKTWEELKPELSAKYGV